MSYGEPIIGQATTITRKGVSNFNPVCTWVQLAQRVPIRVAIDEVTNGILLVSGMTATVTVKPTGNQTVSWLGALGDRFKRLPELFQQPMWRPDCAGTALHGDPLSETLPATTEPAARTPGQIDPGLVPRCLIPFFDGALFSSESKEALWARFYMAAPRRQRQRASRLKTTWIFYVNTDARRYRDTS